MGISVTAMGPWESHKNFSSSVKRGQNGREESADASRCPALIMVILRMVTNETMFRLASCGYSVG